MSWERDGSYQNAKFCYRARQFLTHLALGRRPPPAAVTPLCSLRVYFVTYFELVYKCRDRIKRFNRLCRANV